MRKATIAELEARLDRIDTLLAYLGVPLLILFLVFGLPVLGTIVVFSISKELGCTVNAGSVHPCYLFGKDIGPVLYNYLIGSIFGGLLNPFLFISGFVTLMPKFVGVVWLLLVMALPVARSGIKTDLEAAWNERRAELKGEQPSSGQPLQMDREGK